MASTVGMVMAVVVAALAVDTGRIAAEKRRNQAVADLAAIDAVREAHLGQAIQRARESALRNGFDHAAADYDLSVELGTLDGSGAFVPDPNGVAVRVTATSQSFRHAFVPGTRSISGQAVAWVPNLGGFSLGSALATIDSTRAALLNQTVGSMIGWPTLNLSVASWQGLATGHVTLAALQTQLAAMGFAVGTPAQLLGADLTAAQLFQATAQALTLGGDAANAAVMDTLRISATTSATMQLGELVQVGQGGHDAALAASLNLLQLVTGSAEVINGANVISIPSVSVTLPDVVATTLSLQVVEPPQVYVGPVGGSVSTGQVDLLVTTTLDLPVSVVGLVGARVTGSFPVGLQAAGATGTLGAALCDAGAGISVNADPRAFSGAAEVTDLTVSANVPLVGHVPVLRIPTTTATPVTDGGPTDLFFSFPAEFPPPDGTATSKHAGSEPIGLDGLTSVTTGAPVVLNAVALGLEGAIVAAVVGALGGVLGDIDSGLLTPLLGGLGVDVGGADVTALTLACGPPALAG